MVHAAKRKFLDEHAKFCGKAGRRGEGRRVCRRDSRPDLRPRTLGLTTAADSGGDDSGWGRRTRGLLALRAGGSSHNRHGVKERAPRRLSVEEPLTRALRFLEDDGRVMRSGERGWAATR